jgi:hypothetical protein
MVEEIPTRFCIQVWMGTLALFSPHSDANRRAGFVPYCRGEQ